MKLFKRFSTLKKCAGAAALALSLFALASCENMTTLPAPTMTATASKTLYAPAWPEQTDDNGNPIAGLTYGERYYTVSQGLKRKISLSWNSVEIAKYYEIYAAQNINDTFVKVGESLKAEFDDSVSSGQTYYYKVRAVNSKGQFSEFSSIVKGTSLATPAITDIAITDTSATVFWYMGNVSLDSYAKNLVYEIHAFKDSEEKVVTIEAWDKANQRVIGEYEFENLSGNSEYMFRVDAYIKADTSQVESSPKVNQKTLALYKPVSPEFTASQGESIKNVKLIITLPTQVQVQENKDTEYDSPICFRIQRKNSEKGKPDSEWATVVPCLYFNGTQTAPADLKVYAAYKEGAIIEWVDTVTASANSIKQGSKYDYRIISCVDKNFASLNHYGLRTIESKESDANTATGWAAKEPKFKVKNIERTIDPDDSELISNVAVSFEASWDAMGKDSQYKFAVKADFKRASDEAEGTSWLCDEHGKNLFTSANDINSLAANYDLTTGAQYICGTYTYTLYIISSEYTNPDSAVDANNYLACVKDRNKVNVSENATLPNADLHAEGGWEKKTKLSWFAESGVSYSLKKEDVTAGAPEVTISNADILAGIGASEYTPNEQVNFYDTNVVSGHEYSYTLVATKGTSGQTSMAETAKTLGTADPSVAQYYYNKIVVSWPAVMAAEQYDITLGKKKEFGDGATITLDENGQIVSANLADGAIASTTNESDTITLTIEKPYGFNDAKLSGTASDLKIASSSEVGKDTTTNKKPIWTIGPAKTAVAGTDTTQINSKQIIVKWRSLEGAAGYAVYRTRHSISGSTAADGTVGEFATEKTDVYFVSADASTINVNQGENVGGAAVVSKVPDSSGIEYTLKDNFSAAADDENDQWKINQSYIGLGTEYTYTVLPILAEADAEKLDSLDECKLAGEPYANLAKVQAAGYTDGYGLNLEASKAEYTDRVVLTWDLPTKNETTKVNEQTSIEPPHKRNASIYYKASSATNWTKITDLTDSNQNYYVFNAIPGNVKLEPLEFAVTYNGTFETKNETKDIDATYEKYLAKIENKRVVENEAKSIGYMFTLPAIQGTKVENSDCSETALWKTYNTESDSDRAVGPESYTLGLKNLNYSSDYKPLVTYDKNGENGVATNYSWADATITLNDATGTTTRTVEVKPKFLNSDAGAGTHNGLLKVQRDYKHWYQISATRTSKADYYKFIEFDDNIIEKPDSTIKAHSEDYACRKIKDQEFAKCIGLIICDAINQAGVNSVVNDDRYCNGVGNTADNHHRFFFQHQGGTKTFNWGTEGNTYIHIFRSGLPGNTTSEFASAFTLKLANQGHRRSADGYALYYLSTNDAGITVTHESGLSSYQGTVNLKMGAQGHEGWTPLTDGVTTSWTYTFKKGSTTAVNVSTSNQTNMQQWFPFDIGGDHKTGVTSKSDGLPEYTKTWWQER